MTDIQRASSLVELAIERQAQLEADWDFSGNPGSKYFADHLRNQAKLARDVIAAAARYRKLLSSECSVYPELVAGYQRNLDAAIQAWAEHVNREDPCST